MKLTSFFGIRGAELNPGDPRVILNYKNLGLKSPKLSKYLAQRGWDPRLISRLLELLTPDQGGAVLTADYEDILGQGNSAHFKTCQRLGSPQCRVMEDVTAAEQGDLLLVVLPSPRGHVWRAKVRRCADPVSGETVGWFIDRRYGAAPVNPVPIVSRLLREAGYPAWDRLTLIYWYLTLFAPDQGQGMEVTVPSARLGYQDSLDPAQERYELNFFSPDTPLDLGVVLEKNPWRTGSLMEEALGIWGPWPREPRRFHLLGSVHRRLKRWRRETTGDALMGAFPESGSGWRIRSVFCAADYAADCDEQWNPSTHGYTRVYLERTDGLVAMVLLNSDFRPIGEPEFEKPPPNSSRRRRG